MQRAIDFIAWIIVIAAVVYAFYRIFIANKFRKEKGGNPFMNEESTNPFDVQETNGSADLEYQLEFPPNPDMAGIHLNRTLISTSIEGYDSLAQLETGGIYRTPAPEWVRKIFAIPGVENFTLYAHKISLAKGRMYRWDDILPSAIEIMRQQFAPEMSAVQMKVPDNWHLDRHGNRSEDLSFENDPIIN